MNILKKSLFAAVCIALCTVLPMAFHAIPNGGILFSPMHLPVLLCGVITSWPFGLFCGIVGPLLSFLFTGMPGAPMLPQMMVELGSYGFMAGLMIRIMRTKSLSANVLVSLVIAMLFGRIVAGCARAFLFARGSYSLPMWISSYFISCFPAIILQLVLIPLICKALDKAGLLSEKTA